MLEIFYDGLSEISKMSLDHSTSGSLYMKKMHEEAQKLKDMVAKNQYMYTFERNSVTNGVTQKRGVMEVDILDVTLAQNKPMSQQISMISQHLSRVRSSTVNSQEATYERDADDNLWTTMEEVNYMGNSFKNFSNNPYSNTFNQGWRNHPNFGWKDQQRPQQGFNNNQGRMNQNWLNNRPFQPSKQQMETPIQSLSNLANIISNFSKTTRSFMAETRSSIQNLEIQIGQLSKRIPEIPSNTLQSKTEVNPREDCKALTMEAKAEPKEELATEELKEIKAYKETGSVTMYVPLKMEEPEEQHAPNMQQEPEDEQLAQFLAVLRKLQVNISFAEVLEKQPPSMAYLKNAIS
nr:uncharacterized protein LOC112785845 [Arachis hypogaea]